ncbi:MAG TPA: hypothetical protein VEI49_10960 [Terriglobales bacterium]|nr:hypothetical protein [Terriglobales bacterium]
MNIAITLVVLSAIVLILLIRLAARQYGSPKAPDDPAEQIRFVDIEAFRNLIDPAEAKYLRTQLPGQEFRKIQRKRLHAAVEYVRCVGQNAALLLKVAEAARHSSEPATAQAAEKLVDNAIRVRLYALELIPRLYVAMLLPTHGLPTTRVADGYEQMTRQIILLGVKVPLRGNA